MGNPKLVTSMSVVKFRFEWVQNKRSFEPFMCLDLEWVHLVSQNCPVCLSLVDDKPVSYTHLTLPTSSEV